MRWVARLLLAAMAAAGCDAFEPVDRAGGYILYRRSAPGGRECSDVLVAGTVQGAVGEQESPNSSGQ